MKNVEVDEVTCQEIQGKIDQQKKDLADVRKEAEAKSVEFEKQIEEIQVEWDAAAKKIPTETLEVFNRVAETYDGEALAVAGKQNEQIEAFSCGGCFMGLPAEIVNRLMTKDEIIRCSNCTRILILKITEET